MAKIVQQMGLNAETGEALTGLAHLHQSFVCLLTTDVLTRVMRRAFGFDQSYIDKVSNAENILLIYAEIAELLARYEPRFELKKIAIKLGIVEGQFIFDFYGIYNGKTEKLEVTI